jgi:flagellar protein FlaJ
MTYKSVGKTFLPFFPGLELSLKHAEIKQSPELYLGKALTVAAFLSSSALAILLIISIIASLSQKFYPFIAIIPLAVFAMSFGYRFLYPKLIIGKRVADIEKNLLFSLRHLLIEIRSGISLYESMVSISNSNYGALSAEFRKVTKRMSVGVSDIKALEEVMLKNPSINFRRALWQVSNSIEAGYNLADTLEELVREFGAEQRTAIKMYGSQLNSLALVYMIFAIIMPSIGVCFMIILSFFSGFPISSGLLLLFMLVIIVFQFMFIGIVKSKRPKVE